MQLCGQRITALFFKNAQRTTQVTLNDLMHIGMHTEHLDVEQENRENGGEGLDGMDDPEKVEEEEEDSSMTPEDHPVKFNDWDLEIEKDEDYL